MYLIVDDSFDASSQNATIPEKMKRTKTWARLLFGIVPEEFLQESFDIAFDLHRSEFPVNAYEIKNAYLNHILPRIHKEKADAVAKDSVLSCKGKRNHLEGKQLPVVKVNLHDHPEDSIAPCPDCRLVEYNAWKKDQIARFGEVRIKTILPKSKQGGLEQTVGFFNQPVKEETISLDDADQLAAVHNALVKKVLGKDYASTFDITFNESMNMFKHLHRADKLYSVKDIRELNEKYKEILAKRLEAARSGEC